MSNPRQLSGSGGQHFRDNVPEARARFRIVMQEAKKHMTLDTDGVNNEPEANFRARTPTARTAQSVARDLSMRTPEDEASMHEIQARTAQILENMRRGRA